MAFHMFHLFAALKQCGNNSEIVVNEQDDLSVQGMKYHTI
jgi:hypothetical protein